MKTKESLLVLSAIALVLALVFAACSNGTTGGGPFVPGGPVKQPVTPGVPKPKTPKIATYVSYDTAGNKYELVITEKLTGRTAYDPQNGDNYKLTITFADGKVAISTGTVTIQIDADKNIESITLTHTESGTTVTVNVSGGGENSERGTITSFTVDIPVNSGSGIAIVQKPAALPYTLTEDGTGFILLKGTVDSSGAAVFPPTFLGKPVKELGGWAFMGNTDLISVTIPSHITSLGGYGAFENCTNLTSVIFASDTKIESIPVITFRGCTSLTTIEIPASVTSFSGWGAFENCTSLTSVTFASGTKIEIIFEGTFSGCTSLKNITIPASVTEMAGWGAFWNCTSLTTVTFGDGSKLKTIGSGVFSNCTSLSEITIPAGVTYIGDWAFAGWTSSQTINLYHSSRAAADEAWRSLSLDWRGACGAIFKFWNGSEFVEPGLEYEPTEDGTGYRVISGPKRGIVDIPADYNGKPVTEIGYDAFAFAGITGVTIPASVKIIHGHAFSNCESLTSITIPANVEETVGAFLGCANLTSIVVDPGNNHYTSDGGILYNKDRTKLVAYPSAKGDVTTTISTNITEIEDAAFEACTGITGITIPASVKTIGAWAFGGCTNLTSITIPASVTYVGIYAFNLWTASQTINIEGHANQASADAVWVNEWDEYWWFGCEAKINYKK